MQQPQREAVNDFPFARVQGSGSDPLGQVEKDGRVLGLSMDVAVRVQIDLKNKTKSNEFGQKRRRKGWLDLCLDVQEVIVNTVLLVLVLVPDRDGRVLVAGASHQSLLLVDTLSQGHRALKKS